MKVLLRESIIDFLLQTIVTTSIVGTANPNLQQVCKATFTNCKLSYTLYANFSVDDKKPTISIEEGQIIFQPYMLLGLGAGNGMVSPWA